MNKIGKEQDKVLNPLILPEKMLKKKENGPDSGGYFQGERLKNRDKSTLVLKSQSVEDQYNKLRKQNKVTRNIPVELRRQVWKRDGGCYQYKDPLTGKKCESQFQMELDLLRP